MRYRSLIVLLTGLGVVTAAPMPQATGADPLPKIVLIGDSIRLAYAPVVARELAGKATIVHPPANGGDSGNVLRHLQAWAVREQPDIVHFNCGIHDTKRLKSTGRFQVSPEDYAANLRSIVETLRRDTQAQVVFAMTTPIIDERAASLRAKVDYELLDASTVQYNEIAARVMKELSVPINDLRAACGDADTRERLIRADGVHFTDEGQERLGKTVAEFLVKQLESEQQPKPRAQ